MASNTINLSSAVIIDIITKAGDEINFPFSVTDELNETVNFSGYTDAKLTIKSTELTSEILSFSNTGSTYVIDISDKDNGNFIITCDSLDIESGSYYYDLELSTSTKRKTIMSGKWTVSDQITV